MLYREGLNVVQRGTECCVERNRVFYREGVSVVWRGTECSTERK